MKQRIQIWQQWNEFHISSIWEKKYPKCNGRKYVVMCGMIYIRLYLTDFTITVDQKNRYLDKNVVTAYPGCCHIYHFRCNQCRKLRLSNDISASLYIVSLTSLWRHNEHDSISNHQPHHCLLNRYFGHKSLAFVRGIHRRPVNSPHKGPVTRKMFPFDDVIMNCCVWHTSASLTHWILV